MIVKSLYDLLTVIHFFYISVQCSEKLLLLPVIFFAGLHDAGSTQQGERYHDDRDESQGRTDSEHHGENAYGCDDLCDDRRQVLAQSIMQSIDIICDDAEDIAVRMGVVIVELEPVHFCIDVGTQPFHNVSGEFCHGKALQDGKKL